MKELGRKLVIVAIGISSIFIVGCNTPSTKVMVNEIKVDAPFEMPAIKTPDFSNCKDFLITDFGAVQGDKEKTSLAIAEAITAANENEGGNVIVPAGEWLTKTIHLKSNVNLHLEEGAVLLFSENPDDYLPAVQTTWEGMECYNYSPLVYAYECTNVAITGKGLLEAKLDVWKIWYKRPPAHMNSIKHLYTMASTNVPVEERQMVNDTAHLRPQFIQFNRCENVLLEDISIKNSPFWVIHPYMSKNVILRGVSVSAYGHNNDGVDPEMVQNMLIEKCYFDQGDDAIAVKSGRNQDAWRLNTPTKNLVIRNCIINRGHQLLAIGSELSGGIENVYMDSCTLTKKAWPFHIVFIKTNEQRGGYVKNIHVSNIDANELREGIMGIETDVLYQWRDLVPTYERRLTPISDIYLTNIHAVKAKFVSRVLAQEELPVKNVTLTNVVADTVTAEEIIHDNILNFKRD